MNHLQLAGVALAIFASTAVAAAVVSFTTIGRTTPAPPAPVVAAAVAEPGFNETWQQTAGDAALANANASARVVPLLRITPTPSNVPPIVALPDPKQVVVADANVAKARPKNLCERHNMHKVMVSKYKWRCRK